MRGVLVEVILSMAASILSKSFHFGILASSIVASTTSTVTNGKRLFLSSRKVNSQGWHTEFPSQRVLGRQQLGLEETRNLIPRGNREEHHPSLYLLTLRDRVKLGSVVSQALS